MDKDKICDVINAVVFEFGFIAEIEGDRIVVLTHEERFGDPNSNPPPPAPGRMKNPPPFLGKGLMEQVERRERRRTIENLRREIGNVIPWLEDVRDDDGTQILQNAKLLEGMLGLLSVGSRELRLEDIASPYYRSPT